MDSGIPKDETPGLTDEIVRDWNEAFPSAEVWGFLFFRENRRWRQASILASFIPEYGNSGNSEERIKRIKKGVKLL